MPLARAPRHRSGCRAPARRRRDARPRVRTLRLARRTPRPSTGRTRRPTRVPDGMLPPEGVGERLAVATCCHRRRTPRGYIANRAYGRRPNLPAGTAKPEGERNEASPLELRSVKRPEATRVRRYLRRAEPALAGRTPIRSATAGTNSRPDRRRRAPLRRPRAGAQTRRRAGSNPPRSHRPICLTRSFQLRRKGRAAWRR